MFCRRITRRCPQLRASVAPPCRARRLSPPVMPPARSPRACVLLGCWPELSRRAYESRRRRLDVEQAALSLRVIISLRVALCASPRVCSRFGRRQTSAGSVASWPPRRAAGSCSASRAVARLSHFVNAMRSTPCCVLSAQSSPPVAVVCCPRMYDVVASSRASLVRLGC